MPVFVGLCYWLGGWAGLLPLGHQVCQCSWVSVAGVRGPLLLAGLADGQVYYLFQYVYIHV